MREDRVKHEAPYYTFGIRRCGKNEDMGRINLRLGRLEDLRLYNGNIGYRIEEPYRGHHYAAKACRLAAQVARDYGFRTIWITCDPGNYASRKTIESIGGEFVDITDIPPDTEMYREGERQKCRYRWDLNKS